MLRKKVSAKKCHPRKAPKRYLQADLNSRPKLKLREKQITTNKIIFIFLPTHILKQF